MRKKGNLKIQFAYLFAALAVLSYLSVKNMEIPETESVNAPVMNELIQIYRFDNDRMLIPFHLEVSEKKESPFEIMKQKVALMSDTAILNDFAPVLPVHSELLDMQISDQHAVLNFNEDFLDYQIEDELRILESIVWSATEIEGIESISLMIESKPLSHMPKRGLPLAEKIDRQIGINNFELERSNLYETQAMNLYFVKNINDVEYYVPQSRRVNKNQNIDSTINEIMKDISVFSALKQPLANERVKVNAPAELDANILTLHLNSSILSEEKTCKQQALETLMLSIHETLGYQQVILMVDGVVVNQHGVNDEAMDVSKIFINRIRL